MANANVNLLQINANPSAKAAGAASRVSRAADRISGGNKFSTALDNASAKINEPQVKTDEAVEVKSAEVTQPVNETPPESAEAVVKSLPQGRTETAQEAPVVIVPEVSAPPQLEVEVPAPEIPAQPTIEKPTPEIPLAPVAEVDAPEVPIQPAVELAAPEISTEPKIESPVAEISTDSKVEPTAPEVASEPKVESPVTEISTEPKVESAAPEVSTEPKIQLATPEIPVQPVVKVDAPEVPVQPVVESDAPEIPLAPVVELDAPEISTEPKVEAAKVPQAQPVFVNAAFFFAAPAESLLDTKTVEPVAAAPNLNAVVPQPADSKAQSMLDRLSGKTWSPADVQASVAAQNVQPETPVANNIPAAPVAPSRNLNQPQPEAQPQVQQQPQRPQTRQPFIFARFQPQVQPQAVAPQAQTAATPTQPQFVAPQVQAVELPTQPLTVEVQPQVQPQAQVQPQFVAPQVQPAEVPTQPLAEIQPQVQQQTFGAEISPVVNSAQPAAVEVQPLVRQQAPQVSQALGVSVEVEEAPVARFVAPAPQPQPQQQQQSQPQFSQPQPQPPQPESPVQPQFQPVAPADDFQPQQIASDEDNSFAQNLAAPVANTNTSPVNQPAAQIQNPAAPAQAPAEDFEVPAQIVQQARMIRTAENTEMVINLKPEHLGNLTLRISVSQNGAVNASFFSDNAQVRTIIENSLVQLRQELNDQGLKVENVQVYSGLSDGGLTNGQGQQAWQQNQQQNHGRTANLSAFEEDADALNPATTNAPTDGVDYKI